MRKCFMPKNKFREGIVFMKFKAASVFILFIVLLGFLGIYFASNPSEMHEARRGHTASIPYTAHTGDMHTIKYNI